MFDSGWIFLIHYHTIVSEASGRIDLWVNISHDKLENTTTTYKTQQNYVHVVWDILYLPMLKLWKHTRTCDEPSYWIIIRDLSLCGGHQIITQTSHGSTLRSIQTVLREYNVQKMCGTLFHMDLFFKSLLQLTTRKHQSSVTLALCEWNPPITDGFHSQSASSLESVLCHDVIMCIVSGVDRYFEHLNANCQATPWW